MSSFCELPLNMPTRRKSGLTDEPAKKRASSSGKATERPAAGIGTGRKRRLPGFIGPVPQPLWIRHIQLSASVYHIIISRTRVPREIYRTIWAVQAPLGPALLKGRGAQGRLYGPGVKNLRFFTPELAALGGYLGGFSQAFEQLALQPGYLHLGHAESAGNLGLGLPVEVAAHQDLPFPVIQGGQ